MSAVRDLRVGRLVSVAARGWRQLRYADTINHPYLSGDLFRALCDVALDDSPHAESWFTGRYRTARSIFVKTDRLAQFLHAYAPRAAACRVLITGNSDCEIHEVPSSLPAGLRRWYAQNAFVRTDIVQPLPIGLENQALGRNGVLRNLRRCSDEETGAKRLRLFAAFASSSTERDGLLPRLTRSALVDAERDRLAPRTFHARLRQYRFVIAPRGNGVDTHRMWEALYADAIPVMRATAWSRALRAEGVPLLEVDEWDEVLGWSEADLARWSRAFPARPSDMPWLWEPFWRARIAALVNGKSADSGAVP